MANGDDFNTEATRVSTVAQTDKKCPECGGTMDFSPAKQMLKCPFCDHEQSIKVDNEHFVAKELDFDTAKDQASCDWGMAVKSVSCKSCGAETIYDVNMVAQECPYCGSNQVMEVADKNVMSPSGVVIFTVDDKKAGELFTQWIKGKLFCPSSAKKKARPDAFQGVYIPFWSFDTQTHSSYSGEYGIDSEYTDSNGKTRTKTDWYPTSGKFSYFIDDHLVCGSKNQNAKRLKSIEPYNTTDVKEYSPEYLAGFMAERYSLNMKEAWPKAVADIKVILESNIKEKIRREHDADSSRVNNVDTTYNNIKYKYLLLPVWLSSFKHNGKIYNFMVNGQTGKVSGEAPISWIRVAIAILIGLVIAYIAYLVDNM